MVFESLVVDVLNRFLGDYVVNLDCSQLSLGIWGGKVLTVSVGARWHLLCPTDLAAVFCRHMTLCSLKAKDKAQVNRVLCDVVYPAPFLVANVSSGRL